MLSAKTCMENKQILCFLFVNIFIGAKANALNIPPEDYGRKVETQRNWRGAKSAVDYVV